jgi:hypothetical protein
MEHEPLDDWIASLLRTHSLGQIARIVYLGFDRIRAVHNARIARRKLFHWLGAPSKVTSPIKQDAIELTIPHPKFSNHQIDQITVRSKLKGGVIFLKLAHKSGTVLRMVKILSHKRPFNLLRRALSEPCLCIQNY